MTSAFRLANQVSPSRSRAGYQPTDPLGVVLQRVRFNLGLRLEAVAERTGMEPRTISLVESGQDCHWQTIARYAHGLGRVLTIRVPDELRTASGVQIVVRTGLSPSTVYEVQRWLEARDDESGLFLSSIMTVLSAFDGGASIE